MSTVTPPPPPPPPVVQTAAQPSAIVSNPPAGLTSVAAGTRIDAIIVATTPDGRVEVESRLGRFLLQPNVILPKEGPIELQVQTLARHLFLTITSIHGKQPHAALRSLGLIGHPSVQNAPQPAGARGSAGTPAAAFEGARNPAAAATLTAGSTLTAMILKPARPGTPAAQPQSATNQTAGTAGKTQHGEGSLTAVPPPGTLKGRGAPILGAVQAAAYGSQSATSISPTGSTLTPSGNVFSIRIKAVPPPMPGKNPPIPYATGIATTLAAGQRLIGVVTASPSQNITMVQTRVGLVALNASPSLPAGASIQLEVLNQMLQQSAEFFDQAAAKHITKFLLRTRSWPAFEEAMSALRESSPQAALQIMNTAIPRPDAALAANIMQFLMGIRGGDLAALMGEGPLRILQRDKPDLTSRLRDDFRAMGRISEEPVSGDWRAIPVPVANGAEIQQIQLLMRRVDGDEEDDEANSASGTRFIIDVDLTRMGRVQLDGFVQESRKHFDLVIRSGQRMNDIMQNDIRAIFEDALELTGNTGGIRFQAAPPKFVEVTGDKASGKLHLVV